MMFVLLLWLALPGPAAGIYADRSHESHLALVYTFGEQAGTGVYDAAYSVKGALWNTSLSPEHVSWLAAHGFSEPTGILLAGGCSPCAAPPVHRGDYESFAELTSLLSGADQTGFTAEVWLRSNRTQTAYIFDIVGNPGSPVFDCPSISDFRVLALRQVGFNVVVELVHGVLPETECLTCTIEEVFLDEGELYHIVVTSPEMLNETLAVYINGNKRACVEGPVYIQGNYWYAWDRLPVGKQLYLGSTFDGYHSWAGKLYLYAFYAIELSAGDVLANYRSGPYNLVPVVVEATVVLPEDVGGVLQPTVYDPYDDEHVLYLTSVPPIGTLYQMSGEFLSTEILLASEVYPVRLLDAQNRVYYLPPENYVGSFELTFFADDGEAVSAPGTINVTIANRQDSLEVVVPASITGRWGEGTPFHVLMEDEDYFEQVTVTMQTLRGLLSLLVPPLVEFEVGDGVRDSAMIFTGDVANVKQALLNLTYQSMSMGGSGDVITIFVEDLVDNVTANISVTSSAQGGALSGVVSEVEVFKTSLVGSIILDVPAPCPHSLVIHAAQVGGTGNGVFVSSFSVAAGGTTAQISMRADGVGDVEVAFTTSGVLGAQYDLSSLRLTTTIVPGTIAAAIPSSLYLTEAATVAVSLSQTASTTVTISVTTPPELSASPATLSFPAGTTVVPVTLTGQGLASGLAVSFSSSLAHFSPLVVSGISVIAQDALLFSSVPSRIYVTEEIVITTSLSSPPVLPSFQSAISLDTALLLATPAVLQHPSAMTFALRGVAPGLAAGPLFQPSHVQYAAAAWPSVDVLSQDSLIFSSTPLSLWATQSAVIAVSLSSTPLTAGVSIAIANVPATLAISPSTLVYPSAMAFTITGAVPGSGSPLVFEPSVAQYAVDAWPAVTVYAQGTLFVSLPATLYEGQEVAVSVLLSQPAAEALTLSVNLPSNLQASPAVMSLTSGASSASFVLKGLSAALGLSATLAASTTQFADHTFSVDVLLPSALSFSASPSFLYVTETATITTVLTAPPSSSLSIAISGVPPSLAVSPVLLVYPSVMTFAVTALAPASPAGGLRFSPSLPEVSETQWSAITVLPQGTISLAMPARLYEEEETAVTVTLSQPVAAGGVTLSLSGAGVSVLPSALSLPAGASSAAAAVRAVGQVVGARVEVGASTAQFASGFSSSFDVIERDSLLFSGEPASLFVSESATVTVSLSASPVSSSLRIDIANIPAHLTVSPTTLFYPTSMSFTVTAESVGVPAGGGLSFTPSHVQYAPIQRHGIVGKDLGTIYALVPPVVYMFDSFVLDVELASPAETSTTVTLEAAFGGGASASFTPAVLAYPPGASARPVTVELLRAGTIALTLRPSTAQFTVAVLPSITVLERDGLLLSRTLDNLWIGQEVEVTLMLTSPPSDGTLTIAITNIPSSVSVHPTSLIYPADMTFTVRGLAAGGPVALALTPSSPQYTPGAWELQAVRAQGSLVLDLPTSLFLDTVTTVTLALSEAALSPTSIALTATAGALLSSAWVSVPGGASSASFTLQPLAVGRLTITAEPSGAQFSPLSVEVAVAEQASLVFTAVPTSLWVSEVAVVDVTLGVPPQQAGLTVAVTNVPPSLSVIPRVLSYPAAMRLSITGAVAGAGGGLVFSPSHAQYAPVSWAPVNVMAQGALQVSPATIPTLFVGELHSVHVVFTAPPATSTTVSAMTSASSVLLAPPPALVSPPGALVLRALAPGVAVVTLVPSTSQFAVWTSLDVVVLPKSIVHVSAAPEFLVVGRTVVVDVLLSDPPLPASTLDVALSSSSSLLISGSPVSFLPSGSFASAFYVTAVTAGSGDLALRLSGSAARQYFVNGSGWTSDHNSSVSSPSTPVVLFETDTVWAVRPAGTALLAGEALPVLAVILTSTPAAPVVLSMMLKDAAGRVLAFPSSLSFAAGQDVQTIPRVALPSDVSLGEVVLFFSSTDPIFRIDPTRAFVVGTVTGALSLSLTVSPLLPAHVYVGQVLRVAVSAPASSAPSLSVAVTSPSGHLAVTPGVFALSGGVGETATVNIAVVAAGPATTLTFLPAGGVVGAASLVVPEALEPLPLVLTSAPEVSTDGVLQQLSVSLPSVPLDATALQLSVTVVPAIAGVVMAPPEVTLGPATLPVATFYISASALAPLDVVALHVHISGSAAPQYSGPPPGAIRVVSSLCPIAVDCALVCGGNATSVGALCCPSGVANANMTTCCLDHRLDCRGNCGDAVLEDCLGVCGGHAVQTASGCCASGAVDCAGACEGPATVDRTGSCCPAGGLDCDRRCRGTATLDRGGVCCLSGYVDCAGQCDGPANIDGVGQCCASGACETVGAMIQEEGEASHSSAFAAIAAVTLVVLCITCLVCCVLQFLCYKAGSEKREHFREEAQKRREAPSLPKSPSQQPLRHDDDVDEMVGARKEAERAQEALLDHHPLDKGSTPYPYTTASDGSGGDAASTPARARALALLSEMSYSTEESVQSLHVFLEDTTVDTTATSAVDDGYMPLTSAGESSFFEEGSEASSLPSILPHDETTAATLQRASMHSRSQEEEEEEVSSGGGGAVEHELLTPVRTSDSSEISQG